MTASALALIGFTIVLASFISGVFGMAGGMVLLGVLLVYFDVATGKCICSWREGEESRKQSFPPALLQPVMATKA